MQHRRCKRLSTPSVVDSDRTTCRASCNLHHGWLHPERRLPGQPFLRRPIIRRCSPESRSFLPGRAYRPSRGGLHLDPRLRSGTTRQLRRNGPPRETRRRTISRSPHFRGNPWGSLQRSADPKNTWDGQTSSRVSLRPRLESTYQSIWPIIQSSTPWMYLAALVLSSADRPIEL